MNYFFSYACIFLGAAAVTTGVLGRFDYRGHTVFDLRQRWRVLAFAAGVLLLILAMALYVYAPPAHIDGSLPGLPVT